MNFVAICFIVSLCIVPGQVYVISLGTPPTSNIYKFSNSHYSTTMTQNTRCELFWGEGVVVITLFHLDYRFTVRLYI
jgi:hypothetical protein